MLNTKLEAIADAIRYKRNSNNLYYLNEMPNEINNIDSGINIQPYKVVSYTSSGTYTVTPDSGYEALNSVVVGVQTGGVSYDNALIWDKFGGPTIGSNYTNLAYAFVGKQFNNVNLDFNLDRVESVTNMFLGCKGTAYVNFYGAMMYPNFYRAFSTNLGGTYGSLTLWGNNNFTTLFNNPNANYVQAFFQSGLGGVYLDGEVFNWNGFINLYQFSLNAQQTGTHPSFRNMVIGSNNTTFYSMQAFSRCFIEGVVKFNTSITNKSSMLDGMFNESNGNFKGFDGVFSGSASRLLKQSINLVYSNINYYGGTNQLTTNLIELHNWGYGLRSSDVTIHSSYSINLMHMYNMCNFLKYVWLDIKTNVLGANNLFNNCANLQSVYIGSVTDFAASNNAQMFNFGATSRSMRHNIVVNNQQYFNSLIGRSIFYGGALSGGSIIEAPEELEFEFYNETEEVSYTRNVNTVRHYIDTTKNIYLYCTE